MAPPPAAASSFRVWVAARSGAGEAEGEARRGEGRMCGRVWCAGQAEAREGVWIFCSGVGMLLLTGGAPIQHNTPSHFVRAQ